MNATQITKLMFKAIKDWSKEVEDNGADNYLIKDVELYKIDENGVTFTIRYEYLPNGGIFQNDVTVNQRKPTRFDIYGMSF